jgi:geranylgeranylglycerol-phosphate geranylgeranyltransferase
MMMGIAVIVGSVIAGGTSVFHANLYALILGFSTGFFLTAASMALNDIYDIEIDKINAPQRPLPSGRISIRDAWAIFIVLSAIGLFSSLFISKLSFAIAFASWALSTLYNARLKRTGLPGNMIVSYNVMIPILFGAAIINQLSYRIAIFSVMIFLACLGREIVKGIADVEGDKQKGIKTLAVMKGERKAAIVASLLVLTAVGLSPVPYLSGIASAYYLITVAITDLLFIYSVVIIMRAQDKGSALKSKKIMLLAMALGLLAFLVSNI